MKHQSRLLYSFLLLSAAFIWGMAFVSQSKGMDYMGPLTFNGARSLIGAMVLALYILLTGRVTGEKRRNTDWKMTFQAGCCCGLALTAASTLQQFGIQYTTVGKAGFITTLYIIFVPIAGIFFRRKASWKVWVGAIMAAAGMYLLCMTESFLLGTGDILVFFCAVVFTVHILLIDFFAQSGRCYCFLHSVYSLWNPLYRRGIALGAAILWTAVGRRGSAGLCGSIKLRGGVHTADRRAERNG